MIELLDNTKKTTGTYTINDKISDYKLLVLQATSTASGYNTYNICPSKVGLSNIFLCPFYPAQNDHCATAEIISDTEIKVTSSGQYGALGSVYGIK